MDKYTAVEIWFLKDDSCIWYDMDHVKVWLKSNEVIIIEDKALKQTILMTHISNIMITYTDKPHGIHCIPIGARKDD